MERTTTLFAILGALLMITGTGAAQGALVDHRDAALNGADRLLDVQLESGAFPWIVGTPGEYQNVQGITAIGLLDAYTLSLDEAYLEGVEENRDWLETYMEENEAPLSASNIYFLAKYALLTGQHEDLDLARETLDNRLDAYDGPRDLAETILQFRANTQWTNLGVWDVALFARAAHDVGYTDMSSEFADVLVEQTTDEGIVDAYDEDANANEIGLSGILFGLSEADRVAHDETIGEATDRLLQAQCDDGSFPITWNGEKFCGRAQETAYAAISLTHTLDLGTVAQEACTWLAENQDANGAWAGDGDEVPSVTAEAVQGLTACVLPLHNGAASYADAGVSLLPA